MSASVRVYRNPSETASRYAPYLVVLQSHYLDMLESVVVAPVILDADRPLSQLDVATQIDGAPCVIAVAEMAAMDRTLLKRRVGDALPDQDAIRRAIDRIFTGF